MTRPPARSDRSRGDRRPRPPRRDAGRSFPVPPEEVNPSELPTGPPPALPAGGLRVVALGGIGEVGRNMTVFEHDGRLLIVEGAGGVMVPLTRRTLFIDIFQRWGAPVIVCARTALGTINHTLLTIEALRRRHIPMLGVVFVGAGNIMFGTRPAPYTLPRSIL